MLLAVLFIKEQVELLDLAYKRFKNSQQLYNQSMYNKSLVSKFYSC